MRLSRRWPERDHVVRTCANPRQQSARGQLACPSATRERRLGGPGSAPGTCSRGARASRRPAPPDATPRQPGLCLCGRSKRIRVSCQRRGACTAPRARDGGGRPKKLRSSSTPAVWRRPGRAGGRLPVAVAVAAPAGPLGMGWGGAGSALQEAGLGRLLAFADPATDRSAHGTCGMRLLYVGLRYSITCICIGHVTLQLDRSETCCWVWVSALAFFLQFGVRSLSACGLVELRRPVRRIVFADMLMLVEWVVAQSSRVRRCSYPSPPVAFVDGPLVLQIKSLPIRYVPERAADSQLLRATAYYKTNYTD